MTGRSLLLLAVFTILQACSAGQVYEGLKMRELNLCAEGPPPQYEECLARVEMDYHEYRKLDKAR